MEIVWPDFNVPMGRVETELTVSNVVDGARAEAGEIAADAVRTVTLAGVLVDTGATHLCLPADMVAQLGLRPIREIPIGTAAGTRMARLMSDAVLTVKGRSAMVTVLELPVGVPPLLGVVPMESMGLQPDIANGQLELLPEGPTQTYVTAL